MDKLKISEKSLKNPNLRFFYHSQSVIRNSKRYCIRPKLRSIKKESGNCTLSKFEIQNHPLTEKLQWFEKQFKPHQNPLFSHSQLVIRDSKPYCTIPKFSESKKESQNRPLSKFELITPKKTKVRAI